MKLRWMFVGVALIAIMAGAAMWLGTRGTVPQAATAQVSLAALFAAPFADTKGVPASLGRFQGKVLVLNFWATWCAPCREEMPAFTRLQSRWGARGVQFIGLSNEEPQRVERFARDLGVNYPLWVGGDEVASLARRLGNRAGVLPFTALVDASGTIVESRVGPYTEEVLEARLRTISSK